MEDGSLDCVAKTNRGIVTGEVVRRLAGGERVARAIQTLTDLDSRATVLSIDGIGAFDLLSQGQCWMAFLQSVEGGDAALAFVRKFYGTPSQDLWEDDDGSVDIIHQGEGGEQGDPLMPMLFALGQHQACDERWVANGESRTRASGSTTCAAN